MDLAGGKDQPTRCINKGLIHAFQVLASSLFSVAGGRYSLPAIKSGRPKHPSYGPPELKPLYGKPNAYAPSKKKIRPSYQKPKLSFY